MSTYGKRKRELLNIELYVERSFEDDGCPPYPQDQVNNPTLVFRFNRFYVEIERRKSKWFLNRESEMVGTPWAFIGWYLESKPTEYLRYDDWTEYHDWMVK